MWKAGVIRKVLIVKGTFQENPERNERRNDADI